MSVTSVTSPEGSATVLDGVQEAFKGLQITDTNGVPIERDGAHRGERLEASRDVHSYRANHGRNLILAKFRPPQMNSNTSAPSALMPICPDWAP